METVTEKPAVDLVVVPVELVKAVESTALAIEGKATLRDAFAPHFVKFHELAETAKQIAVNAPKAAQKMRLALKAVRVASEKTRKALKDDILVRGRAIDSINAILELQISPIEDRLEQIEKAEEIAEAKRKADLKAVRESELQRINVSGQFYDLANMPEADWVRLRDGIIAQQEAARVQAAKVEADRLAAEKKAADERKAREVAEAAERERMRLENERLKKEAAEKAEADRQEKLREQARREVERQKAAIEKAQAEAKAEAERQRIADERAEEKRIADEKEAAARKEWEKLQAKFAKEKAERDRVEAELKAKEKAEADRIEAEKVKAAAALAVERENARKAAAAPDKEKLQRVLTSLRELEVPLMNDSDCDDVAAGFARRRDALANWFQAEIAKL